MSSIVKFKDLSVGDEFVMDKGVESGLLSDIGHAGSMAYRKISAKRYVTIGDAMSAAMVIGSVDAEVWKL